VSNESGAASRGPKNWLALTGLISMALLAVAYALIASIPGAKDSLQTVTAFYSNPANINRVLAAAYLVPIAGILFLSFIGVLRGRFAPVLEESEEFEWIVVNGSAILLLACLFIAATAAATPAASTAFLGAPLPNAATVLPFVEIGNILLFVFAMRAAAAFMIFASRLGLRGRSLPRWLAIAGIVLGLVLLFSISYASALLFLLPLWVAVLSIYIFLWPRASVQ